MARRDEKEQSVAGDNLAATKSDVIDDDCEIDNQEDKRSRQIDMSLGQMRTLQSLWNL